MIHHQDRSMNVNTEVPPLRIVSGRIFLPFVSALVVWLIVVPTAHA
jgi:hypothetical protein